MIDTLPTPASSSVPAARQPRRHLGVVCRRGTSGLGPNLAVGLVDLTEDRLKFRLTAAVPVGEDMEIELTPPGNGKSLKLRGEVIACRPARDGKASVAKVRLRQRLTFRQFADLTT
jgi:hypothetical protein